MTDTDRESQQTGRLGRRDFLRVTAASALVALPAGGALSACGGDPAPGQGGRREPGKKLRIAQTSPPLITYPAVVWGPITYGERFGVPTTKENFTTFESHSTAVQTMLSGKADLVIGSFLSTLALASRRDDFRAFGPSSELDDFILVGIDEVDSCEKVFARTTLVGTDSPGGSGSAVLEAILRDGCGGRSQKALPSVKVIESSGLRTTALASGQIKATVIHLDQADLVKKQVGAARYHEIHALFKVQPFIRSAMASTAEWLAANKDAAAGLVAATFVGHRDLMRDYDLFVKAVKDVVEKPPEDEAQYRRVWELARQYRFWPINAEETLQQPGVEFMTEIGLFSGALQARPDISKVVDREILRRAEEMAGPMTRQKLLG